MSFDHVVIDVKNLSKHYEIYATPRDRLKQILIPSLYRMCARAVRLLGGTLNFQPPQYFREFWALRDVSFQVKKGETLGIIGRNGSGKSTLLQLICSTLSPTSGDVVTKGRISALLELGSGFNPEYTGRENIYLNGQILGLSQNEIESRYDKIIEFADIGEFIDQPVKTYSSGMVVRLAFAVAINVEPEILIVDEALAVGDMNFQAKCMTALSRIQERGATVLFVSHDIGSVKSLCSRAVYLEGGSVRAIGSSPEVAAMYVRAMREESNAVYQQVIPPVIEVIPDDVENNQEAETLVDCTSTSNSSTEFDARVAVFRYGTGGARIVNVELINSEGFVANWVDFNEEVKIRIYCELQRDMEFGVAFQIMDEKQNNVTESSIRQAGGTRINGRVGESFLIEFSLRLPLRGGTHSIQAHIARPIHENVRPEFVDVVPNSVVFKMAHKEVLPFGSSVFLFPTVTMEKLHDRIQPIQPSAW